MPFVPPRCPNTSCKFHLQPSPGWIIRWGFFAARCRDGREQRFRCRGCHTTFSRQTFRYDYRDRRPDCNARLFELLTSGVGLRQSGRVLKIALGTVQKKMGKLAGMCWQLHENLSTSLPPGRTYLMDEEESYEGASIRPLTIPILIEQRHWFVVATAVGPIRRLAAAGTARRVRQDRDEAVRGKRPDRSRQCCKQVLRALRRRSPGRIQLWTDEKPSYATVAREVFGEDMQHVTTAGTEPRTTRNRLFPINITIAMTRDNCGRLRRNSWLVSKKGEWLARQMSIYTVFRNYVRRRFNRDEVDETPAKFLGLLPRQLQPEEVVRWRQDWGRRSVHPMSFGAERTVGGGASV